MHTELKYDWQAGRSEGSGHVGDMGWKSPSEMGLGSMAMRSCTPDSGPWLPISSSPWICRHRVSSHNSYNLSISDILQRQKSSSECGWWKFGNPRVRHPWFWSRIQRLSLILTRVLLQEKEGERKKGEWEGMGADKPIVQFKPRRMLWRSSVELGNEGIEKSGQKWPPLFLTCVSWQAPTVARVWAGGGVSLPGNVIEHIRATPLPSTSIGLQALESRGWSPGGWKALRVLLAWFPQWDPLLCSPASWNWLCPPQFSSGQTSVSLFSYWQIPKPRIAKTKGTTQSRLSLFELHLVVFI